MAAALIVAVCSGCASSDAVEQAQVECESRDGHTELLPIGGFYRCYVVTTEEDGWRLCERSEPHVLVRANEDGEPNEMPRWPCGNTGPRYDDYTEPMLLPQVEPAPKGCEPALAWYQSYLAAVEQAALDGRSALASETIGVAQAMSAYESLGLLLEQNTPRVQAARDTCSEDRGIDGLGALVSLIEIEDEINETYRDLVKACIWQGGIDCGVLAPTAKKSCEEASPEFTFLLNEETLEVFGLDGWPHAAYAIGCTLT